MSATDRTPDSMEPGERMDNSQKTILLMLFDDRVPWTPWFARRTVQWNEAVGSRT